MTFASFSHDHSGAGGRSSSQNWANPSHVALRNPRNYNWIWSMGDLQDPIDWSYRFHFFQAYIGLNFREYVLTIDLMWYVKTYLHFRIRKFALIWRQSNNCNDKTWAFDHERLLPRCPEMMSDGKIQQIVPCSCRIFQKRSIGWVEHHEFFLRKNTNLVSRTLYVSDSSYIQYLLKQKSHVQSLLEVCAFPCFMRQHCELRICPTRHSMLERSVICHSSHLPPANQCCYCVSGWSLRLLGYSDHDHDHRHHRHRHAHNIITMKTFWHQCWLHAMIIPINCSNHDLSSLGLRTPGVWLGKLGASCQRRGSMPWRYLCIPTKKKHFTRSFTTLMQT
jgi:hypothetical protein